VFRYSERLIGGYEVIFVESLVRPSKAPDFFGVILVEAADYPAETDQSQNDCRTVTIYIVLFRLSNNPMANAFDNSNQNDRALAS
jgi:hypothetical protein